MLGASDEEITELVKTLVKNSTYETPDAILSKLRVLSPSLRAAVQQLDDTFINVVPDPDQEQFLEARDLITLLLNWEERGTSSFSVSDVKQVLMRLQNSLEKIAFGNARSASRRSGIGTEPDPYYRIPEVVVQDTKSSFKVKLSVRSLRSALILNGSILPKSENDQILTTRRMELLKVFAGIPSRERPNLDTAFSNGQANP